MSNAKRDASKSIEIPEGGLDKIIDIIHAARELQLDNQKLTTERDRLKSALKAFCICDVKTKEYEHVNCDACEALK